jgi:hypothetical protein
MTITKHDLCTFLNISQPTLDTLRRKKIFKLKAGVVGATRKRLFYITTQKLLQMKLYIENNKGRLTYE